MRIGFLLGATALAGTLFTSSVATAQSVPNVPSASPPKATTPGQSTAPNDPTEQAVTVGADGGAAEVEVEVIRGVAAGP